MSMTIEDLAGLVGGEVSGDGGLAIVAATSARSGRPDTITFAENEAALEAALAGDVGAVVVGRGCEVDTAKTLIRADHARIAFVAIAAALHPEALPAPGVHERAFVDPTATLGEGVSVGPSAVVGAGCEIGAGTAILPGAVVREGVTIGPDCRIHPNVVLYPGVTLGARVVVHAGSVLGSDGFGYVDTPEGKVKFPQIGTLVVADDVEIGANTTIDRAALDETRIGRRTKIDNLVQIAHNVVIGEDTAISSQVGIAGTAEVGSRVVMGGQAGVGDHAVVEDGVVLGGQTGVPSHKRLRPGAYWSTPARPVKDVLRQMAEVSRLSRLRDRVEAIEAKLPTAKGEES
jgi:UDP-3-O-[3-hydroxymyristoyl] glucosamine N-acyltransferase